MFGDFLYKLSARDLAGPLISIVHHTASVTSIAALVNIVTYSVPIDQIFILKHLTCQNVSGNASFAYALLSGPSWNPVAGADFPLGQWDLRSELSAAGGANTSSWFGWDGEIIIPPSRALDTINRNDVTVVGAYAGTPLSTTWRASIHGYTIPKANLNFI